MKWRRCDLLGSGTPDSGNAMTNELHLRNRLLAHDADHSSMLTHSDATNGGLLGFREITVVDVVGLTHF